MIRYGKFNDILNLCFAIMGICFLFMYPANCIEAAKDGLTTALYIALPSIFPFMVLSKFIIAGNLHYIISEFIGKPFEFLFGVNKKYAVIFVLGCIGGYPIGAITINEMLQKKEISVRDAQYLLGFCNNCGPMFIIGTVGSILLNNATYGYVLYIIHILCVILCGIIMRLFFKHSPENFDIYLKKTKNPSPLSSSVTSSGIAMINIGSYIIIFSVIASFVIKIFGNTNSYVLSGILCFLEITTGIKFASSVALPELYKISLISAAIGFSGLCVFSQSKAVFENIKISFFKYFFAKIIIAVLSFILTYTVFTIIFSH